MENIVMPMEFQKEKKKLTYDEAYEVECPYEAFGSRVILIQVETEEGKKKNSGIYIPEHVKKSMESTENFIVPSIVKSIGVDATESSYNIPSNGLAVNDIVYTYPAGYEAKITINNIEYLIFSKRDILLKVK